MRKRNKVATGKRLSMAMVAVLMAASASAVDLISNLIRCADGMKPYVEIGGEERTSGKFYGYKNAGAGPGDNAFKDAKAWADAHNTPLVVVFDTGGGNSNTFIADLNDDEDYQGGRYLLQWMNSKAGSDNFNCMFTYFKGTTTAPPACKDAYEFCRDYGASSYPCVVCYWKWPDGTIKTSTTSGLSSVGSFEGPVNNFLSKNKPPPTPPYVPPKSNAAFAAKDGEMKATVDTAQVYVPIIRTNGTERAETEYLVAAYPDGAVKTNNLAWTVGGAYIESPVDLAGRLSKVGNKVSLYLLTTNQTVFATNSITCVAKPANSTTYPSGIGAGDLSWGEWTIDYAAATSKVFNANAYLQPDTNELGSVAFETPLDWSTSNRYDTVYTNDITVFASERLDFEREFTYSVSNVNTVVVTNDLQLFAKLGEFENLDHAAATEVVVTNTTTTKYVSDLIDHETTTNTQAVVASVEATNTVYRVVAGEGSELATNKWSEAVFAVSMEVMATNIVQYALAGGGHESGDVVVETNLATVVVSATGTNLYYSGVADDTRPFERVFQSGDFVTNCVYAVAPGDGGPVTNDYRGLEGTWLPASAEFRAYATENVTYLLTETADSEVPAPVSEDSGDVVSETTFRVPDAATYYFVESNDFTAETVDFSFAASNSVSYVFNGGATTNVDEAAYVVVAAGLSTSTTNFVSVRLADGSHPAGTVTEYGDFESRQFSMSHTNAYFSVETNSYQYGISGSSEEPSHAFTLVVRGGIVWDDSLIALNDAVLSSGDFADWCEMNQIAPVYLDVPEPGTGASLFSYNVASNGNSGAEYMSLNGLTAADGAALIAQAAVDAEGLFGGLDMPAGCQIALVRADGSIGGFLRPQFNADGSCNLGENIDRLYELIWNAVDKAESANDTPDGALETLVYQGDAVTGTLTVNDTVDWFAVAGLPSNTAITFDVVADPGAPAVSFALATSDGEEIPPAVSNVWVLTGEQVAAGVYVGVGAYLDDASTTEKFDGLSEFGYEVSATAAPVNHGKIGFTVTRDIVKEGEWESVKPGVAGKSTNYVFQVARTEGLSGAVRARVSLDMSEEEYAAIHGRFEWEDVELTWADLEAGAKDVTVVLKNDDACYDASDIVFKVEVLDGGAALESGKARFTLTLEEEDPPTLGFLEISGALLPEAGDGRLYTRSGESVKLTVSRVGGANGSAVGTVIAKLAGKSFATNEYTWAAMESGIKTNSFAIPAVSDAKSEAVFALASSIGKGRDTLKLVVLADDAPIFDSNEVAWSGIQYTTTATNLVALGAFGGMSVKGVNKISGAVPAGLKVAVVEVDGKWVLAVTGTPTAGARTTATFWVTLVRDGGGAVYSMPVTVAFESKALEDVNPGFTSARTWTGLPVVSEKEDRLVGLLDLTVAKNGRTSARYRRVGGKTVAFSAPGLARVDDDGNVALYAEKSGYALSAMLGNDGSLSAMLDDPDYDDYDLTVSIGKGAEMWSSGNSAERFGGNYTVALPLSDPDNAHPNTLCFGSTALRLKFSSQSAWNRGVVTFAGSLPNGKSVSGTATLVPTTADAASADLPVFVASSSDTLSALLAISNGVTAAAVAVPFWRHDESKIAELSYENDCDVIGAVWSPLVWTWTGERLNLNKTSGIASGTMRLDIGGTGRLTTVTWRGVAIPGDTPAVLGAYWYNKSMPYGDGRKRTVRVGNPVEKK